MSPSLKKKKQPFSFKSLSDNFPSYILSLSVLLSQLRFLREIFTHCPHFLKLDLLFNPLYPVSYPHLPNEPIFAKVNKSLVIVKSNIHSSVIQLIPLLYVPMLTFPSFFTLYSQNFHYIPFSISNNSSSFWSSIPAWPSSFTLHIYSLRDINTSAFTINYFWFLNQEHQGISLSNPRNISI